MRTVLSRLRPDPFLAALVAAVALASILPSRGAAASALGVLTPASICLLFFLHGAKLSREALLGGLTHWRLQLAVLTATFVMFPLLGLAARGLAAPWLSPELGAGLLFLCLLPSTVQSSIAFTSTAGGNVAASVCSASLSNLLGIVLTPLLVALLMGVQAVAAPLDGVRTIVLELLLPFVAGHLARPWIGAVVARRKRLVGLVDRTAIVLVVYTAFSAAVVNGFWTRLGASELVVLVLACVAVLAAALVATTFAARALRFSRADEISIVFCGSKKSLASGVPIAGALFPAAAIGPLIVPLMLFHQIQLMACAVLAQRYRQAGETAASREGSGRERQAA